MLNLVQSYVTLRVPLFVSYLFHSPAGAGGWQHFDLKAELRLTFVYDTAILWDDGIGSPPGAELQGAGRAGAPPPPPPRALGSGAALAAAKSGRSNFRGR